MGTNDYKHDRCNIDSILAGHVAIIKEVLLQRPDATIVINSILPRDDLEFQPDYERLNRRLKCLADTSPKVHFFDATSLFLTDDGQKLKKSMFYDKLHPSELGARVFGDAISKEVIRLEVN